MLSKDLLLFLEMNSESLSLPVCLYMYMLIVGGCHGEEEDKDIHNDIYHRSQNCFSNGHIVNIFGFVDHMVFVTVVQKHPKITGNDINYR